MKKRVLSFSIFILLIVVFASIQTIVKAAIIYSDNNLSSYEMTTRVEFNQVGTNTTHFLDLGNTMKSGALYSQQVNVLTQKQTADSKVVTWAIGEQTDFTRRTIIGIAQDYEKNHPDWVVVGGINADQYATGFGENLGASGTDYYYPQPYYPMICDGEGWFAIGPLANGSSDVAGFLQDGSKDPIFNGKAKANNTGSIKFAGLFLSIYDEEGNKTHEYKVDNYNTVPKDSETTIYSSYYQKDETSSQVFPTMDINGNLFVIEDAERAYPSNSVTYRYKGDNAADAFFGKGIITSQATAATIGKGQFAIDTRNTEVQAALAVGKKVVVQYKYEGVLSNVESAIGFHTIQRMDGKDVIDGDTTAAYNTKQYPRSLFGRKSNGDISLIIIDGVFANSGSYGTSTDETNAVLKYYGLVEAYQMDGGGSATAMIRNADGQLVVKNKPADGSARSVFSALLFVERKNPEVSVETEITENTISFSATLGNTYGKEVADIVLVCNSKEYIMEDGKYTVTGLRQGREYNYQIFVQDSAGNRWATDAKGVMGTLKSVPILEACSFNNNVYTLTFNDPNSTISDVYLEVGAGKYRPEGNTIQVAEYDERAVLVYTYNIGRGDVTIRVPYPEYTVTRFINEIFSNVNNLMKPLFK